MDTQTGRQAALFDAPRDERQAPLFGGLYMGPDELAELDQDQAAAAAGPLVLVGCGAGKLRHAAPAAELYTGQHFRACLATARAITTPDRIRILSAAHGLLRLDQETAPYDVKMGTVGAILPAELRKQAEREDLTGANVIVLAAAAYQGLARSVWPDAQTPLAGLGIGQQRRKLAEIRAGIDKLDLDELAERRHVAKVARQREIYLARADEARDHRKFCLKCVPGGRRCRDGKKLDTEQRLAGDVYGAMMRGEL